MNDQNAVELTVSLRAMINQKRRQGQTSEPLLLARLGAQFCRQNKKLKQYDEVSRIIFDRYLEFIPDDQQVRQASAKLLVLSDRRQKKLPWRFSRMLIIGLIFAAGTVAGVFHHYTFNYDVATSKAVDPLPEKQSASVGTVIKLSKKSPDKLMKAKQLKPEKPPIIKALYIDKRPITIRAVGDIVLGNSYHSPRLPGKDEIARITALQKNFAEADIILGNLEGVLLDQGMSRKDISLPGIFSFRMPESYASVLKNIGFDVLSLANNHALDFGEKGLESTVENLSQQGIKPIGVPDAQVAFVRVKNTTVAFLAYSYIPGLNNMGNRKQISNDIKSALRQANLVMISVHAGKEGINAVGMPSGDEYYKGEYRGNIVRFSEYVIDNGASAVFGHGPHVVRPYKIYKGKPIFFSLGNFIGYKTLSTRGNKAFSVIAEVSFSADGKLIGAGVIPLKLNKIGIPAVDYSYANLANLEKLLNKKLKKARH